MSVARVASRYRETYSPSFELDGLWNFGDRNCTTIRVHNGRDSLQTESESPLLICPPDAAPRWCYFADSSSTQFELTSSSTLFKQRPRSGGLPRLLISVPPSVTINARESANKFTRRVAGSYSLERQCAQCNLANFMLIADSAVMRVHENSVIKKIGNVLLGRRRTSRYYLRNIKPTLNRRIF